MDVEQIVQRRGGGAEWLVAIIRLDDRGGGNAHHLVHWGGRWVDTMQSLLVPEGGFMFPLTIISGIVVFSA